MAKPSSNATRAARTSASSRSAPAEAIAGGPTRRPVQRERGEALEARVLKAAIDEFAEHGFAGARIERISRTAGTVDRMLYYYFGNKERLYQAVLEKIYADMIGAERGFVMPDDPVDGMRELVRHAWDHYVAHPDLVRLLMNENLLRGKFIRQSAEIKRTSFPLVETVSTLLAAGQARGVFRSDASVEQTLMTIMSLGFFYLSNQYTCSTWLGGKLMSPARRKAWRQHICEVVLASLAPVVVQPASPSIPPARRSRRGV